MILVDVLLAVVEAILPITLGAVERAARAIVLGSTTLSARDAVHLAVMEEHGVDKILSFDRGCDGFPGASRIGA